jgi:hypothetical protein
MRESNPATIASDPSTWPTWLCDMIRVMEGGDLLPVKPYSPVETSRTFTVFPKLPLELQDEIWSIAACQLRTVEIECSGKVNFRFRSGTLAPAILHAYSASRRAGLKIYEKLSFSNGFAGTYINWNLDNVLLNHPHLEDIMFNCQRRQHHQHDSRQCMGFAGANSSDLAYISGNRRRLAVGHLPNISLGIRFENLEAVSILQNIDNLGESHCDIWQGEGNIELVPSKHHMFAKRRNWSEGHKKEQLLSIMVQQDDLRQVAARLDNIFTRLRNDQWVDRDDRLSRKYGRFTQAVEYLKWARSMARNIPLMIHDNTGIISLTYALRGKEKRMTEQRKTQLRKATTKRAKGWRLQRWPRQRHSFKNLRVSELKQEADARGLSREGSKGQLIKR